METRLEIPTFQVKFEQASGNWRASADIDQRFVTGGWMGTKQSALLTLYLAMTEVYPSFRLEVFEGEKLVQELVYREVAQ
jgi:hypothetical protein